MLSKSFSNILDSRKNKLKPNLGHIVHLAILPIIICGFSLQLLFLLAMLKWNWDWNYSPLENDPFPQTFAKLGTYPRGSTLHLQDMTEGPLRCPQWRRGSTIGLSSSWARDPTKPTTTTQFILHFKVFLKRGEAD